MANVKKINQAACILSGFNFEDVGFCEIDYYFAAEDGKHYGGGASSFKDKRFREWGKKEWRECILDSVRWYTERGWSKPTHVASIRISFVTNDQEISDLLCSIEMTDLSSGFFDRLFIRHHDPLDMEDFLGDVACTIKESSRIRGARDVVKLTRKIPQVRINEILTDLPKVVLADLAKSDLV